MFMDASYRIQLRSSVQQESSERDARRTRAQIRRFLHVLFTADELNLQSDMFSQGGLCYDYD